MKIAEITNKCEVIHANPNNFPILSQPFGENSILFIEEDPIFCYERVINKIDRNKIAYDGQKQIMELSNAPFNELNSKNKTKKITEINNKSYEEIMNNTEFKNFFVRRATLTSIYAEKYMTGVSVEQLSEDKIDKQDFLERYNYFFQYIEDTKKFDIYDDFHKVENILDNIMKSLLVAIGYHLESENKAPAITHDTTHSIYGYFCDFLITRDKKFHKKVDFIYKATNAKTKLIFADREGKWLSDNFIE